MYLLDHLYRKMTNICWFQLVQWTCCFVCFIWLHDCFGLFIEHNKMRTSPWALGTCFYTKLSVRKKEQIKIFSCSPYLKLSPQILLANPDCPLLSRSPPQWKCSAVTARWCPTATAPVTTRSQTTSSSACLVSGRTQRRARPSSSKPWTRACRKSGTCAIEAAPRLMAAREPASLINQGSKPYLDLVCRFSSWEALVCLCRLCNSVTLTTKQALNIIYINIFCKYSKNVNETSKTFYFSMCVDIRMILGPVMTQRDSADWD